MSDVVKPEHPAGQSIIVVLGMHRSGTSMCAHLLSMLGLDMADQIHLEPDAPKGHWERPEIRSTQARILEFLNRDYYGPLHGHALPPGWWANQAVRGARNELTGWLRHRIGNSSRFGFKDPRTCRLMPMWKEIFADLGLLPRYVFCVRDPRQVCRSITVRDRPDYDDSEYRWMVYNAHAVTAVGTAPVCVVPYESWFADPAPVLARLAAQTGAPMPPDDPELKAAVADVIDVQLRHDGLAATASLNPITQEFYQRLTACSDAGRFTESCLQLAQYFVGFERLTVPAQNEFARMRAVLKAAEQSASTGTMAAAAE